MRLLISDANILIDMEVGGLLPEMFRLRHRFGVPDVLFTEELARHHATLPDLGLQVLELQGAGVKDALSLLERHGASGVSRNDVLALALARQERCPLLTGDKRLRGVAEAERNEVFGTLWLVEELVTAAIIGAEQARAAYAAMRARGRRLPWSEVQRQLERMTI